MSEHLTPNSFTSSGMNPLRPTTLALNASENLGVTFDVQGKVDNRLPDESPTFWLASDTVCQLEAQSIDELGVVGIDSVSIIGDYVITCIGPLGLAQQQQGSISQTVKAQAGPQKTLNASLTVSLSDLVKGCAPQYSYQSLNLQFVASSTNWQQTVTTPTLRVINGPGAPTIRVATFNIGGDQKDLRKNPVPQLERYGHELLSQVDIAFLQEVLYKDWVRVLSESSGLAYQYSDGATCVFGIPVGPVCVGRPWPFDPPGHWAPDVAILSRFPLVASYSFIEQQKLIDATVSIEGATYRLLAAHFAAGDNKVTERTIAANAIRERVRGEERPIIVAGDFNTNPTSVEFDTLTRQAGATDAYTNARVNLSRWPQVEFCSVDGPSPFARSGDWILFKGPYMATTYQSCLNSEPSDHACVITTLGRAWDRP
ncbi:endonuclease/exonuclease/phosphatase family protein [Streptomyces sp. NPDC002586]